MARYCAKQGDHSQTERADDERHQRRSQRFATGAPRKLSIQGGTQSDDDAGAESDGQQWQ